MLRNKIRYLLLLSAIGMISILYNVYYMGIFFLVIAGMPFLLFGLLCYIYGNIKAEVVSVVHIANKGNAIPITILLHNPTIFPVSNLKIYLSYKNAYSTQRFKKSYAVSIDSKTTSSIICNLYSGYAGNLEIALEAIRIYDYMKLFSLKKKQKKEFKVAVLPYYNQLEENDLLNNKVPLIESDYYSKTKSGDDPSEVFAIREYREGDRPQRIHWKLSRKQDQLMIKEFSDPLNCSVLLFVNISIPKGCNVLNYMDAILECALSLSYSLLMKGQMHYLAWYDERHGACTRLRVAKEEELFDAVDGLLNATPYTEATDALSAYIAEHPNDQYTDLIYITGDLSMARIDSLSIMKAYTKQMICISDIYNPNNSYMISSEVMQHSTELGIGLSPVGIGYISRDLEQLSLG